jgi:phosphonate transport system substrate-binding protein
MRILDNWLYPLLNSLCLLAVFSMVLGHQPAVADSGKTALSAKKEYTMGVFPHLPPRQLEKVFAPMAKDLGNAINRHIILRTNTTYKKFAHNLDNEKFDIAFIQPFDYIRVADKLGYLPLVTRKEKLTSILVVKTDSPLNSIADIKGQRVAFPPAIAAVSRLMKVHFKKNKLQPGKDVTISHHRSHVSCMQQVLIGEADACGTAAPALRFFQHKMKVKLKVIAETDPIPHTLFAIHPRVPEYEREIIRERMVNWAKTRQGRKLLDTGKLSSFIPIENSAYDIVREFEKQSH